MDLLLWRWSTGVQFISLLMLAGFFLALSRSSPRAGVGWWSLAWLANLAALALTTSYWYFPSDVLFAWIAGGYAGAKLAFILLLLQGAWTIAKPGAELFPRRILAIAPPAHGFVVGLFLGSLPRVGLVQHSVMGVLLLGAVAGLGRDWRSIVWLATGLGLRGALALVEAAAYWVQAGAFDGLSPADRDLIGAFLAARSSFDAGAEWFIALGCVLALSDRVQRELSQTNQNLLFAQEHLRRLADRDPLTALENRRSLPDVLRTVQPEGAVLIFMDLDGFKQINDLHGHAVGDRCLKRFAVAVRESFRPSDAVVRFGGDEFLVVARGLDRASALERLERIRVRLDADPTAEPRVLFSYGVAELEPGGSPEAALHDADRAMYASREQKTAGSHEAGPGRWAAR
jgi:diguanylate cyclase (GGDEF)-like protein